MTSPLRTHQTVPETRRTVVTPTRTPSTTAAVTTGISAALSACLPMTVTSPSPPTTPPPQPAPAGVLLNRDFLATEIARTIVGSIGTMMMLRDTPELMKRSGVKPMYIATGDRKAAAAPGVEITEATKQYLQGLVADAGAAAAALPWLHPRLLPLAALGVGLSALRPGPRGARIAACGLAAARSALIRTCTSR